MNPVKVPVVLGDGGFVGFGEFRKYLLRLQVISEREPMIHKHSKNESLTMFSSAS